MGVVCSKGGRCFVEKAEVPANFPLMFDPIPVKVAFGAPYISYMSHTCPIALPIL